MTARRPGSEIARRSVAVMLAGALALVACADEPAPVGDGSAALLPAGGGEVVLRLSYEGGFVPVEYHLLDVPAFTLYGDGTVITPGAQIELYPGPALPAIVERRVDAAAIEAIVERALAAGLGQENLDLGDMGTIPVADASTAVFTLTVDGRTTTAKAYALGLEGEPAVVPGLPPEQLDLRRDLAALASDLGDLSWVEPAGGTLGPESMYHGESARLIVGPLRDDPQLPQDPIAWPLADALRGLGEPIDALPRSACAVVEGEDWATLRRAAEAANQLTPWTDGATERAIAFRPLLPDESGC